MKFDICKVFLVCWFHLILKQWSKVKFDTGKRFAGSYFLYVVFTFQSSKAKNKEYISVLFSVNLL